MAGAVSRTCDGHGAIGMSPSTTEHVGVSHSPLSDVWLFHLKRSQIWYILKLGRDARIVR